MRASPYDLRALGLEPIAIENPDGRADYERRQTGSHVILRREHRTVVVPMHRPIKPGTLAGLIAQSGVSLEAFCAEL